MNLFEKIDKATRSNEEYLKKLLPEAEKNGNELLAADIMGRKGKSFTYNLLSGLWVNSVTLQSGAGVIELVAEREGIPIQEAATRLGIELGFLDDYSVVASSEGIKIEDKVISQGSKAYPKVIYMDDKTYPIQKSWQYTTTNGYYTLIDAEIEGNQIVHLYFNGSKWQQGLLKKARPVYNLHRLTKEKNETVIVTTDIKSQAATAEYFPNYTVTCCQGGIAEYKKTNWDALKGRKVIFFPSANHESISYFNEIANKLFGSGTNMRFVDFEAMSNINPNWTVADALEANMPQDKLVEFVKDHLYNYEPKPSSSSVIDPEVIIKRTSEPIYDHTYYRCLGVQGDSHFFYKKRTSQIIEFKPSSYDSKHLISLAPLTYWQANYPEKRADSANWIQATDDLCRIQEQIGIFDNTKIRGRGAWFDAGRTVLHLGNVLFTNGKLVDIDDFSSEYLYERAPSLAVKVQSSLPASDSRKLIDVCRMARWEHSYYGDILAGWMFSALVCGAMPFRSHLYLVGAAGTGKSWMLDNIVKRVMGNIALSVSSKSTEAGIREQLGGDIRPIIFDEAEAENQTDKVRMQAVFDLARNGSSEKADAIVKFGAKYLCRSAFLFASINLSMSKTADLSRTALIKLANSPVKKSAQAKETDNANFRALESAASRLLTDEFCRCLLSRAISLVPVLRESHRTIADVAAREFGSRRLGDQMAMIIAGLWGLQSDYPITEEQAKKLITETALQADKLDEDDQTQEENALSHLMFSSVMVQTKTGTKHYPLNLLLAFLNGTTSIEGLELSETRQQLQSYGVKIDSIGSNRFVYLSINKSTLPTQVFSKTEWEAGWQQALCRIEGVEKTANTYFCTTLISRSIKIPLSLVINKGE